ncbi:MAG: hypothetical protein HPY85_01200 [Anaerolineae bacterium]|nr:hypothetical protein [Anaerolineae bacterium]
MKAKRIVQCLGAILLLAGMLSSTASSVMVEAKAIEPPAPGVANGSWQWTSTDVTGTIIPQFQVPDDDGDEWSLLLSSGLQVSGATQICHPFRGGQIGWVSEIRMLVGKTWVSVPTTTAWMPDEEGELMTCASAQMAGTYAIFGYWVKPEGWMESKSMCPPADDWVLMYDGELLHPDDYCVSDHEVYSTFDGFVVDLSPRVCCNNQVWAPPDFKF